MSEKWTEIDGEGEEGRAAFKTPTGQVNDEYTGNREQKLPHSMTGRGSLAGCQLEHGTTGGTGQSGIITLVVRFAGSG